MLMSSTPYGKSFIVNAEVFAFFNEIFSKDTLESLEFSKNFLKDIFSGPTRSIVFFEKIFAFNAKVIVLQTS